MRYSSDSLDYVALLSEAHELDITDCTKTIRVAILADCATQNLAAILRVLAARNSVKFEIYEGEYDGVDFEILNPKSGLYAFDPQYIIVFVASEKLKTKFYEAVDRSEFASSIVERFESLWEIVRQNCSATIVQGNFVLPTERAFGNYELKIADSLGSVVCDINYELARKSRGAKNVLLCDVDFLAAGVGRAHWFDARMWNLVKSPCKADFLPALAQSMLDVVLSAAGFFAKCLILDLDNTLWGGVIGDDGLGGIALGEFDEGEAFVGLQKFIKELKRRGIILAVVSKNDHANAISPFKDHRFMVLKEDDIAVFIANWDNKADNIRLVQKSLNIGFDSMVFLDDNPFERNVVREFLPQVVVPELPEDPSNYLQAIAELNLFETASFSTADRERADQYREEVQRELIKTRFTNIDEYLRSLDMKVKLERFNAFNLPRIAQLIQRSNQFNLLTRRYSEATCESLSHDANVSAFTLSLADKYGDYGLISVIILRIDGSEVRIDEYLMSCRVLQRGVEAFAMNNIFDFAKRAGATTVLGGYDPTAKNAMVKDFFARFGFNQTAAFDSGASRWALNVNAYEPREVFMTAVVNELLEVK